MIKKTIFLENPCHLSTQLQQLVITQKTSGEIKSIPIEDIGMIITEHAETTITQKTFQLLIQNNAGLVICDEKHLPAGMLLPLECHQLQSEIFRSQISASEPLKKQIWQQIIRAKIANQATLLKLCGKNSQAVFNHIAKVKSGDTTNEEAQASRKYWEQLFDHIPNFHRERSGDYPNAFLNYGYAILRGAVARALIGSGLLPTLGIHHHSRYNAFPLADDIMEPYRPFVDQIVYQLTIEKTEIKEINKEIKKILLSLLTMDILFDNRKSPLMVGLSMTTASVARCFRGEEKKIVLPQFVKDPTHRSR